MGESRVPSCLIVDTAVVRFGALAMDSAAAVELGLRFDFGFLGVLRVSSSR